VSYEHPKCVYIFWGHSVEFDNIQYLARSENDCNNESDCLLVYRCCIVP